MSKSIAKMSLALVEGRDTEATRKIKNEAKKKQKKNSQTKSSSKIVKKSSTQKNPNTANYDIDDSIKKILLLSSTKVEDEEATRLFKRAKSGHYVLPEAKREDNGSVFTEEDFAKFEREFFCS